jgi:2-polyprenyl-3-methyl-5-hydroxy-6-metoxy-1,4-benzoquinol methylase
MNKADKKYWDDFWIGRKIPKAVNLYDKGLKNFISRCFHEYFLNVFSGMETQSMKLLEIGCAGSAWLPYFAKEFGFKVFGLDYSEIGCQQALNVLSNEGVKGEIFCADFFKPPEFVFEKFDVVISFGVAEHFKDTSACIKEFSKYLKPGGIMITNIPNMVGISGKIQKTINRPVFDIHVLLDKHSLRKVHERAGLDVLSCDYFIWNSFGICNLKGLSRWSIGRIIKKTILVLLTRFSMMSWFFESRIGPFKPNKIMSPYINCLAYKHLA